MKSTNPDNGPVCPICYDTFHSSHAHQNIFKRSRLIFKGEKEKGILEKIIIVFDGENVFQCFKGTDQGIHFGLSMRCFLAP
jgi:hypothetical protein